ncbi:telomeric repeat binding factor a [Neosynchiropus ocellatus]
MATERKQVEKVVTRWLVDYYCFLALDSFKKEQFSEFNTIKDFLGDFLIRAELSTDVMPQKVLVLQFLSAINEGGKLGSVSPLESALMLLENICEASEISPQDLQCVRTSIQKIIIMIYIKNMDLDRAKEMVHTYFSSPNGSDRSYFLSLISSRCKGQQVDENILFGEFQTQMLAFCEKVWTFSPPFLYKAATELNQRLEEVRLSAPFVANYKHGIIQRSRLEKAYNSLASGMDHVTFVQLEEDAESEQPLSLRLSPSEELMGEEEQVHRCSEPISQPENPQTLLNMAPETPTHTPPQTRSSLREDRTSLCQPIESDRESSPAVSELLDKRRSATPAKDHVDASRKRLRKTNGHSRRSPDCEVPGLRTPSKSPVQQTEKETDGVSQHSDSTEDSFTESSPVHHQHSTPLKRPKSHCDPSTSKWLQLMKTARESKETWPEEESFFRQQSHSENSFTSGFKKMWTDEETAWLKEGVKKFGEGKWSKILSFYGFKNRTNVNLKDRWRTMKKLNMI